MGISRRTARRPVPTSLLSLKFYDEGAQEFCAFASVNVGATIGRPAGIVSFFIEITGEFATFFGRAMHAPTFTLGSLCDVPIFVGSVYISSFRYYRVLRRTFCSEKMGRGTRLLYSRRVGCKRLQPTRGFIFDSADRHTGSNRRCSRCSGLFCAAFASSGC